MGEARRGRKCQPWLGKIRFLGQPSSPSLDCWPPNYVIVLMLLRSVIKGIAIGLDTTDPVMLFLRYRIVSGSEAAYFCLWQHLPASLNFVAYNHNFFTFRISGKKQINIPTILNLKLFPYFGHAYRKVSNGYICFF